MCIVILDLKEGEVLDFVQIAIEKKEKAPFFFFGGGGGGAIAPFAPPWIRPWF